MVLGQKNVINIKKRKLMREDNLINFFRKKVKLFLYFEVAMMRKDDGINIHIVEIS